MNETQGHYANRNKPDKDKYRRVSFIWGIKEKNVQHTETRNKMVAPRGKGTGNIGLVEEVHTFSYKMNEV